MSIIKIPKQITTPEEFVAWFKTPCKHGDNQYLAQLRKSKFYAYNFRVHNGKVHYLKSDGVGTGLSSVNGLRRNIIIIKINT